MAGRFSVASAGWANEASSYVGGLSFSLYYMYTSVGTPLSRLFWHPPATLF